MPDLSVFAGQSALVTGASAGLGEEFARQLAAAGAARLVLTARRADRLDALKASLHAAHPALRVDTFVADLTDPAEVDRLTAALDAQAFHPAILINNAGLGDLGLFETAEPARIEAMLAVNVAALTRLTRWAVPAMVAARSGWIGNVGSTAGLMPLPSFAVYAATKAYVNSFSEALRIELRGAGVSVTALCPGPVKTEFGGVASRPNGRRKFAPPAWACVGKEKVVRDALLALAARRGRVVPGWHVRLPMLFLESVPRWILRPVFNLAAGEFARERAGAKRP